MYLQQTTVFLNTFLCRVLQNGHSINIARRIVIILMIKKYVWKIVTIFYFVIFDRFLIRLDDDGAIRCRPADTWSRIAYTAHTNTHQYTFARFFLHRHYSIVYIIIYNNMIKYNIYIIYNTIIYNMYYNDTRLMRLRLSRAAGYKYTSSFHRGHENNIIITHIILLLYWVLVNKHLVVRVYYCLFFTLI